MPYKARGRRVYVKKMGRWLPFRTTSSDKRARKMAAAMNINTHKHTRKKRR